MRDLVVQEALSRIAAEAAERFATLVASGEEIPFEVGEEEGTGSPLYCYRPLTERFIREHAEVVRALPGFGAACAAIGSAGLVPDDVLGAEAPGGVDPRGIPEEVILSFLGRLWDGTSEFSLESDRLDAALAYLETGTGLEDVVDVVVPIVGLQMPVRRAEVGGVTLVRADTVDVPPEARRPDGLARTAWEPQIVAWIRTGIDAETPSPVTAGQISFRKLITALRLFKSGGVGLAPHAWTRTGDGAWRRIVTGAARPRGGGYWLTESDLPELAAFAAALEARPLRGGSLRWAIARFEMGCERSVPLESVTDHLLALRALLEGGGPADMGVSIRVAALCAEPEERTAVREMVDRSLSLERVLMRGVAPELKDDHSAVEAAYEIEEHTRAILRDAAAGHLGPDLRATADEILLADGIAVTGPAEPAPEHADRGRPRRKSGSEPPIPDHREPSQSVEVTDSDHDLPAPEPAPFSANVDEPSPRRSDARLDEPDRPDWMTEVGDLSQHTLEWPALTRNKRDSETPRAQPERHLFPVPDTIEWEIGAPPERAQRVTKPERPASTPAPPEWDPDEAESFSAPI